LSGLNDVLIVTVRKSFWASPESTRFPRRLYAHVFLGRSTSLLNSLPVFVRTLVAVWLRPPQLVLLGSVERTVPWFIRARRLGLLRGARLVVTNQLNLTDDQLEQVDRVIVYAREQAAELGTKGAFLALPADGDFEAARRSAEPGEYVFSGGGAGRDFETLIEAVRGTGVMVEIVTFDLSVLDGVPANVRVGGPVTPDRFLSRMAGAKAVVVPLVDSDSPHGQTMLVQALSLGRPVIATRSVGVIDYVENEREGLLVEARDVAGLRAAILRFEEHADLRARCASAAADRAAQLTYERFAAELEGVCRALL
jgi:hypothetical protein